MPVTAALPAGYGIAVPAGAVGAHLVSLTARTSLRTGVCAALGLATADGLYALAAVLGGSALASALRPALGVRAGAGGVGRGRRAPRQYRGRRLAVRSATAPPTALRAYLTLLGIILLNPATVICFAALVLGSQGGTAAGAAERTVFVAAAFAASASRQVLLAGGGALLGRALTGHRGRLVTGLVASGVTPALALRTASAPG
ncbi:lysine transporter LysE [Streptomyces sp. MA15]|uniref:lysine transporter LysE n=1 Tax=Streptomyces sp. MA15 TaxID=3055061 RepID=UPI0025AFFDFC|nr:lysine transporter LysE [Streptomyces sp. MA15]MDN3266877.1 lysine transporter LysE [Streptomyces sp. MA15]